MRFVTCEEPGFTRRRAGKGWVYFDPDGKRVKSRELIARLNKLAIPPAYMEVWICPDPDGHLQAVGRDARGRRQYLYHPDWRRRRDRQKYDRTIEFGRALASIRRTVAADLRRHQLDQRRVTAAVIRLLDLAHLRVGNAVYAKTNKSYGATTLEDRHATIGASCLRLRFTAKGGKLIRRTIADGQLARIVRRCHELPGHALFCYLDDKGGTRTVTSDEVNDYLKEATGDDFSAKHFRTWSGSVTAYGIVAELLREGVEPKALTLKQVVDPVAKALGNTPAICKASYIHPKVLLRVADGKATVAEFCDWPRPSKYLSAAERAFLVFLEQ